MASLKNMGVNDAYNLELYRMTVATDNDIYFIKQMCEGDFVEMFSLDNNLISDSTIAGLCGFLRALENNKTHNSCCFNTLESVLEASATKHGNSDGMLVSLTDNGSEYQNRIVAQLSSCYLQAVADMLVDMDDDYNDLYEGWSLDKVNQVLYEKELIAEALYNQIGPVSRFSTN